MGTGEGATNGGGPGGGEGFAGCDTDDGACVSIDGGGGGPGETACRGTSGGGCSGGCCVAAWNEDVVSDGTLV